MIDISPAEKAGDAIGTDLFQILRDGQPRTRSELSKMTGLARSTVAMRVDSLVKLGLISPIGDAASTGGRPSTQFALNASQRVVLGVDIGASHARVALSDLNGKLLAIDSEDIEVSRGPEEVLGWVVEATRGLLERQSGGRHELLAIGVGLPGPVQHDTGLPIDPPIMPGWDRYDVPAMLGGAFGVPVLVDNDVNIMALGEREINWPDVDDLIFVKVATGIGAGVISSGQLQRGAQGIAGDIGHVYVPNGADIACRCGNYGCLEAVAAGPAIARQLSEAGLEARTSADVMALVRSGNTQAVQAVREAGRVLGEVLTTCISLMNPAVIVLGGPIGQSGEHLLAGAREVVYKRTMPLASGHLQITRSLAGANAALIGASMLAIHHALSPERVEAMLTLPA